MPSTAFSRPRLSRALSGRDRIALVLVALSSPLAVMAALPQAPPGTRTPVAILFPPWTSGQDALAQSLASGHRVLRPGRVPYVVVVAPAEEGALSRPRGALLQVALAGLAGCLDAPADDRA